MQYVTQIRQDAQRMTPLLIAGLGNNAAKYDLTRHNVGFSVVDALAGELAGQWGSVPRFSMDKKNGVEKHEARSGSDRILLVKSLGFMNECGPKIARAAAYYSIPPSRILVIHDELDRAFGDIRLVTTGGDNGHNGLRSLSNALSSKNYARLRIGIGRPSRRMAVASYVLQRFSAAEQSELPLVCADACDAVTDWLKKQ